MCCKCGALHDFYDVLYTSYHTPHIIALVMCAGAKELVNNRVPAGLC